MPRIAADSIEEHVRLQTERILTAAGELFSNQGYGRTDMRDIAKAVGLARNSLYRYYPNKDHILLAFIRREMDPYMERIEALRTRFPDPRERVDAWVELLFGMAAGPAHAMMDLMTEVRETSPELRKEILRLHRAPVEALDQAIAELPAAGDRDPAVLSALISGCLYAATSHAVFHGNPEVVYKELRTTVDGILEPR